MNILNLSSYNVLQVEESEHDYHITAEVKNPPAICPNGHNRPFVGFGKREEVVMDVPMHGKRVGIYVQRKRYQCKTCESVFYERLPNKDKKRQATTRLVSFIERESLKRTFTSIADEVGLDEKTVRNIFRDYVNHLEETVRFEVPQWMGIDEIHIIRKPRCVISNIEHQTIVDVLINRNKTTVARYLTKLKGKDKVQYVAMDMWNPYRDAVNTVLPQARIVVDKFHVLRMANQALETIRKENRAELPPKTRRQLVHDRFVLLKRNHDLNDRERLILSGWTQNFPRLGQAYDLKEAFYSIYVCEDRITAQNTYYNWLGTIPHGLKHAFKPIITAMGNWHDEVFAYFDHPITNAYTESLNNLIRVMNRLGRGYSFDALRAKILFTEGLHKKKRPLYNKIKEKADTYFMSDMMVREEPPTTNYGCQLSTLDSKIESGQF